MPGCRGVGEAEGEGVRVVGEERCGDRVVEKNVDDETRG